GEAPLVVVLVGVVEAVVADDAYAEAVVAGVVAALVVLVGGDGVGLVVLVVGALDAGWSVPAVVVGGGLEGGAVLPESFFDDLVGWVGVAGVERFADADLDGFAGGEVAGEGADDELEAAAVVVVDLAGLYGVGAAEHVGVHPFGDAPGEGDDALLSIDVFDDGGADVAGGVAAVPLRADQ